MSRLARFAWFVLAYNVAVILWGAYVRATGSGAGCGSHWPLCNGQMIPRDASVTTLIEYSHRLTSGLALVAVVALLVWTWRATPSRHPARRGAVLSVVFMVTEAAVGAGLVLFQLVADNATMARAMFMAVHLLNTFVLLACITLTAWWLSGRPDISLARRGWMAVGVLLGCAALMLVGTSGAIAALGDTLFPSSSLGQALRDDLSATSHLLIRLRVLHPVLAVTAMIAIAAGAPRLASSADRASARLARWVAVLGGMQVVAGFANVFLLAPVWMQLLHLLLADAIWIAFVLLGASALSRGPVQRTAASGV